MLKPYFGERFAALCADDRAWSPAFWARRVTGGPRKPSKPTSSAAVCLPSLEGAARQRLRLRHGAGEGIRCCGVRGNARDERCLLDAEIRVEQRAASRCHEMDSRIRTIRRCPPMPRHNAQARRRNWRQSAPLRSRCQFRFKSPRRPWRFRRRRRFLLRHCSPRGLHTSARATTARRR